jgi:hypothetical protein
MHSTGQRRSVRVTWVLSDLVFLRTDRHPTSYCRRAAVVPKSSRSVPGTGGVAKILFCRRPRTLPRPAGPLAVRIGRQVWRQPVTSTAFEFTSRPLQRPHTKARRRFGLGGATAPIPARYPKPARSSVLRDGESIRPRPAEAFRQPATGRHWAPKHSIPPWPTRTRPADRSVSCWYRTGSG